MLRLVSYLGRFVNWEMNYGCDIIKKWIAARPQQADWKFLDVGCGRANHMLQYLSGVTLPYERRFGVEVNDEYISVAREHLQVSKVDLEIGRLPYEDSSFGVVVANQVFEHIKNVFWLLSEMDRCTQVGGYLIVGVPNLASLHSRVMLLAGLQPTAILVPGPHVRGFTAGSLRTLFSLNPDFRVVHQAGANFYPFPTGIARLLARMIPSMAAYTFILAEKLRHAEGEWQGGGFIRILNDNEYETNYQAGKMPDRFAEYHHF